MRYTSDMDPSHLWWEDIAGPARFAVDIEAAAADGRSVICCISHALSYPWVFREEVMHRLSEHDVSVSFIDCDSENEDGYRGGDITEFLLESIHSEVLTDYRRRRSLQYVRESGCLAGRMLWLYGVSEEHIDEVARFVASWRSKNMHQGLLLLEVPVPPVLPPVQCRCVFAYDEYVTPEDLRLFASILANSRLQAPAAVRQYAVELAAALCGTDGELAAALLDDPELTQDPLAALARLKDDSTFADTPRAAKAGHPFALLAQDPGDALRYRIWSAQVRVGYPCIETIRQRIIRAWYDELSRAIVTPYHNDRKNTDQRVTDAAGNEIDDPHDVEVGTLCLLMAVRSAADPSQYLLYLPDPAERETVFLLRDCRNRLAHLDICESGPFLKMLDLK